MFDWGAFTLFLYIMMRMAGFVLFNPVFGRSGIPSLFKSGMILALSVSVFGAQGENARAAVPATLLEFALRLMLELSLGFVIGLLMRFFLYIPQQAGEFVDTQMGMSMAKAYDAGSQASMTTTANLLNILMILLFFTCNGHVTLLRMLCTSGEIVPFGAVSLGDALAERGVEMFVECALLAVKLGFPILAAELLGQVGMGVLMKAIPQINVFAINIELKVLIGLFMLLALISPMSQFLLQVESQMLGELREVLTLLG